MNGRKLDLVSCHRRCVSVSIRTASVFLAAGLVQCRCRFAISMPNLPSRQPSVVESSTYERSGVTRTSHKLECFLVSSDPAMYCLGTIKDQEAKLKDLMQHFKHGSCWLLSKVKLDAKSDVRYNSCPNKVTVTLSTTTASPAEDDTLADEVVPAHGVNNILQLCDKRSIDLMGVLRDTEDNGVIATAKGKRQKYTLNIVDQTDADAGTYHVQIALWDAPESQWGSDLAKYKGSVVRLFGIYADFPNGNLALTASSSFRVADAGGSDKAKRLQQASADLLTGDAVTVAAAATRSAGASLSTEGDAVLTLCSVLENLKQSAVQTSDCLVRA